MLRRESRFGRDENIARLKMLSGWCIETRRRQDRITQAKLAARSGVAVRWLREIEGGDPRPTIDDHLRCAAAAGLSVGYILIPLLCDEHGTAFLRELLLHDLRVLEQRCIETVARCSVEDLLRGGAGG